jgi:hypothetical protein
MENYIYVAHRVAQAFLLAHVSLDELHVPWKVGGQAVAMNLGREIIENPHLMAAL